jgi:membrane-associated phospholipid phosphatase
MPSDHALLSFTAALLAMTVDRKLGAIALAFAVVVALSRVETLLHSPLDVLASAVFAGVAVGAGMFAFKSPQQTES